MTVTSANIVNLKYPAENQSNNVENLFALDHYHLIRDDADGIQQVVLHNIYI